MSDNHDQKSSASYRLAALDPDFILGDSMRGAGIQDGDLLLVERDPLPRDGAIVVAWLGDGFTVKRLRRRQGLFWLEAAHPAFPPLPLDQPGSQLWGRVIHVIRRL